MKKSWSFISLVAALAVGGASAQTATPPTAAGTEIKNKAEITFTPEGSTTPTTTPSNEVVTTVLPVPSFSITPNDNNSNGPHDTPHYNVPGQTDTVKPCQKVVDFLYTLRNEGNLDGESYQLTNTAPDAASGVKAPTNVRFYAKSADADGSNSLSEAEIAAATPITSISGVNMGQSVQFFQVYEIPCDTTVKEGDKFGADPTGTRNDNPNYSNDPTLPKDADNTNVVTVGKANDQVYIGPKADPLGATDPVTTPAYPSPEGITITPTNDDKQTANLTSTQTVITFTNTVKNTGERPDLFEIAQANNLPAGTKVELLKPDGTPLPDADGDGKPELGTLLPGQTADFLVKVTLPAAGSFDATNPFTVTLDVTGTYGQTDPSHTYDIITVDKKPGLSFGDPTPTPGGDPTQVGTPPTGTPAEFPNGSGNPTNPIKIPDNCTAPVRTYLPMEIANVGNVSDSYNVSGTAPIYLIQADGTLSSTPTDYPVTYYKDVNGDGKLDAGDTLLTDSATTAIPADTDTIPDTGILKPGEEMKLIAVVDVPCAAGKQVITLNQIAKSPTTGVSVTDPNDTITVGGGDKVAQPDKKILVNGQLVNASEAKPGDTITYKIAGKNTSNGNITKAMVCDTLPTNTSYVSWSATSDQAGTILYSKDGGATWSAATPVAPVGKLCAAVDTNGDSNITTADVLAPGKSINVTFQVKVN